MMKIYLTNLTEKLKQYSISVTNASCFSNRKNKACFLNFKSVILRPMVVLFSFLILLIPTQKTVAQGASNYTFVNQTTGSLVADFNGNTIDMSIGTTLLVGPNSDDVSSAIAPIGFNFSMLGSTFFTAFSASSNGVIRLGNTVVSPTLYGNTFPPTGMPVIAPYLENLRISGSGKVHYKLFGAYPNRTLVVEFLNMSINNGGVDGTYQLRLYEQTNAIEFVYGTMNVGSTSGGTTSNTAAIGFANSQNTNGFLTVNQNTFDTSFTAGSAITNLNSSIGPIVGLTSSADGSRRLFRFVPKVKYKTQFLSMATGAATWCPGETRNVTVTIKNIGTLSWTNSPLVDIGAKWGTPTTYSFKVPAGGLAPGNIQTYTLSVTAPLTASTDSLTFDAIYEATPVNFSGNTSLIGPGNIAYSSSLITITAGPVLITQPSTAAQKVCLNGSFTPITIIATGAATYQWYSNIVSSNTGGTLISGATSNSYTPLATTAGVLYYYCIASNTCGTSSNISGAFTVNALPVAGAITGVSGICILSSATLNSNATGAAVLTYSWTSSNTVVASNTLSGATFTSGATTGTTNIIYTVTDGNNCTANSPAYLFSVTTPTAGAITGPNKTCVGSNITLTAAASGAAPYTYTWASTQTAIATVTNAGVVTGKGVGSTNITYTVTDANGCSATSAADTITVNAPVAGNITGAAKVCSGGTVTLVTNATGTGPLTYTWASANTGIATITNTGVLTSITGGVVNITYIVTDANGCSTTSANYPFTVNALPVANIATGAAGICLNSSINLAPNVVGVSPFTYVWSSSNSSIIQVTSTTAGILKGQALGQANISYIATDANGCVSAPSPNDLLTVATQPTAGPITQASNLTVVCVNQTLALSSNGSGTGTLTYLWNSSNTAVATVDNSGIVTGISAGNTNITYTTINNNACASVASAPYTITVNAIPTGSLSAVENSGSAKNDNSICAGASITFNATKGYSNYNFRVNGISKQAGSSNSYATNSINNGDVITVDVVNGINCGSTFNSVTITVTAYPAATISADKTTICTGDLVTFTAAAGPAGTTYAFKVNGTTLITGSSNLYSNNSLINGDVVSADISNANFCTASTTGITITVKAVPSGSLSASATTVCAGDNIIFTATAGFTIYEFKVNGATVQGPAAANIYSSTTITNGQVVAVVVSNSAACSTTFNQLLINVNPIPAGSLTSSESSGIVNDNIICPGGTVNFSATAGYTNYNFKVNGLSKQNTTGNTFNTSTLVNNDSVSVDVTGGSCVATFNKIGITVLTAPTGSVTYKNPPVCSGDSVFFNATAGYANYLYSVNSNPVYNGPVRSYITKLLVNGDVVSLDVTNTYGCKTSFNSTTMVINPRPSGTLAPIENSGTTANDGIICTGANVVFTAPSGYATYTFLLNGITVLSSPSNTYSNNTLLNGDKVSVTIATTIGCAATLNVVTITVNNLPAASPITGASMVCVNSTTPFTTGTTGGIWSSTAAGIATVNASGIVTGVAAGTATINYTLTNSNGCTSINSLNITVNALPVVAAISGNTNVCVNSTTQLTDAASGGTWSSSNTGAATISAAGLVTGIAAGTTTISYSVTNINNCTTTVTTVVTVNALPVVLPITVTAPATFNVCAGSTITVNDATPSGVWSSSNTAIATISTSGVITGVADGITTISYTVTNSSSCVTAVTQNVSVHALPNATISGANPLCPNATNTYTTESGQTNYSWVYTGGTLISGGTLTDNTITIKWNVSGTKSINVNYSNAFGCTGNTSATFTTSGGFVATITGPASLCLNTSGTYTTQIGESNYVWSVTKGIITSGGTSTSNTATITWNSAGAGSVSTNFTDINGCTAASPTIYPVTVNVLPTATISGTTVACINGAAPSITFTGTAGTAPFTFTYNINGGLNTTVTTSTGNSVTVSAPTTLPGSNTYNLVSVADNNSCTQTQSGSATVTVKPLPTGSMAGLATVCQNSASPNVTFTGVVGTAPFTFTYSINGGAAQTVSTISGNIVTVAAPTTVAGSFVYTLVSVADVNGCSQSQSGSATINVNPSPAATISGTTSVCIGGTAPTVTFTGAGGTAPYKFTYNINGGANTTVTSVGASVTVSAPTGTAGSFNYNLISVQDASTTACSQTQTGKATITVNPLSVGGTVSASAHACYNINSGTLTLSGNTGNVLMWQFSKDNLTSWTDIANTTNTYTYTNITQTISYRAVVQSGVCASANSAAALITVDATTKPGIVNANAIVCSASNGATLTLTANTGSVIKWESSIDGGVTYAAIANITATQTYSNLTQTTFYRAQVQSGVCAIAPTLPDTITVKILPSATITGTSSVCLNGAAPLITFIGNGGTPPYTFTYNINGAVNKTITTVSGNTVTLSAPTSVAGTFNYNLISVAEGSATTCFNMQSGTAVVTVNTLPVAPTLTPVTATICQYAVLPLLAGTSTSNGNVSANSGTINLTIPDSSYLGNTNALLIAGIPAGASITGVSVNFNITHPNDADLIINLKAPNNNVLNLVNKKGGKGSNFTNTTVSNSGTALFTTSNVAAPFTGTFAADAFNPVTGAFTGGGNTANVSAFSSLYGTPNGNWVFSVMDTKNTNTGIINSWSISVNYTLNAVAQFVVWSPVTDLYTDAGATIAYASQSTPTVYTKPSAGGTVIYTATSTNSSGCSNSSNITLTVNPVPVVTITADYCTVPKKVRLTANSTSTVSYLWSTGANTQSIDIDVSDDYQVTVTTPSGCTGTALIAVAQDLVVNGDFTAGNTGFTSDYTYQPDVAGNNELVNDAGTNGYGVGTNGQNYHPNFWGTDHTNNTVGARNFMLVNGHGTLVVWKESISVIPNTTYYFSAWGLSLNSALPVARLQFNVNGIQVGTIDTLAAGVNSNANTNWSRFYGNWTSGPTTTSVNISITDLESSLSANDFAIDDISFATLSTFITLTSAPGTDAQVLCTKTPITNIVYNVGNGTSSGPLVTGLPAGVTSSFVGSQLTISGSPTATGSFTYTITTTGTCNPTSASGTITAQSPSISLSSGNSSPVVCVNSPVNISLTIGGTATGATVTGLPSGVTAAISGSTYTISGTPVLAGSYLYTVTTTGGACSATNFSGTITVQSQTITLNSAPATTAQTLCNGSLLTNIQYTVGGSGTGATAAGLPPGISGIYNSGFFIISGTPAGATGTYNYTVTTSGTCGAAIATGSVTITPAAVGGTLPSVSSCGTVTGTLTLTGQTGSIIRWETSVNNGATWATIANTTTAQAYTSTSTETFYRVVVGNICGTVNSSVAIVGIHNVWTGFTSSDWGTPSNWADGNLPSVTCPNVTIPATLNNPVLSYGTGVINNLIVNTGATLTITNGVLKIAGSVTNNGIFDVSGGTVEFNGTTTQNIAGSMFYNNTLLNLVASNTSNLQVANSAGNLLNVTGVLAFGNVNNATLTTGNNLVLISTATGTARVADITNNGANTGNIINGLTTVERFYPARRAWRLVTAPLSGAGTVFSTWQNGGIFKAGRGTYVSGPGANAATNGMDSCYQNKTSLKMDAALTPIGNTFITNLSTNTGAADNKGYFMFIRGDRVSTNFFIPNCTTTTLSSTGKLQTNSQTFNLSPVAGAFSLIGNPFASPVDFTKLVRANVMNRFYVWDPYLNTQQGGYVMLDTTGSAPAYTLSPSISPGGQTTIIQSSQAFFVQTLAAGPASITFTESAKSSVNNLSIFRPVPEQIGAFRTNLYFNDADTAVLADGNLAQFDNDFKAEVNEQDAMKLSNVFETFGILNAGKILAADRRPILLANDTIFYKLIGANQRQYQLRFVPSNLNPDLTPLFQDSYTGKTTELSISQPSAINFTVDATTASQAENRFRIVFVKPLVYTSVNAALQKRNIAVDWSVENEFKQKYYQVERADDSINFVPIKMLAPTAGKDGKALYHYLDATAVAGDNYYRINNVNFDSTTGYSKIVKVTILKSDEAINVYPNPVEDGIIGLQLSYLPAGLYHVRLINNIGQIVLSNAFSHPGGTALKSVLTNGKLTGGMYKLEVTKPDKSQRIINVLIK